MSELKKRRNLPIKINLKTVSNLELASCLLNVGICLYFSHGQAIFICCIALEKKIYTGIINKTEKMSCIILTKKRK
jgi:hypothetical protein